MQQFTVPQFIDVEDKIIGPITARQFVLMLGGFLIMGILYKLLDFSAFLFFSIMIFITTIVFSFVKINGMPFHFFVLNFVQTVLRSTKRVWNNKSEKSDIVFVEELEKTDNEIQRIEHKMFNVSRLAELSLIVDTQGAYRGENKKNISSKNLENKNNKLIKNKPNFKLENNKVN